MTQPPTPNDDSVLPPWMRRLLTEEEEREINRQRQQIQLPIPEPMPKEQVVDESDIIEEEGRSREFIEFDIS